MEDWFQFVKLRSPRVCIKKIRKNLKRKKFYIKKCKKVDLKKILIRVYYIQYGTTFFPDEIFLSPFGTVRAVLRTTPNSGVARAEHQKPWRNFDFLFFDQNQKNA